MRAGRLRRSFGLAAVAALAVAPALLATAALAEPSATSTATVANETELRDEWGITNNTVITLTADIDLSDCKAGDPFRDTGGSGIVIDGQGLYGISQTCDFTRVLLDNGVEQVTLRGLTHFDGGFACGAGGGLYTNGSAVVENSNVSDNTASGDPICVSAVETDPVGGGVYTDTGGVTVIDSTFEHNHATLAGGGFASTGPPSVSGSTFTENSAGIFGAPGGGDDLFSGAGFASLGAATVATSTFTGNFFGTDEGTCTDCAVQGAGFWAINGASVSGTTFANNLADCEAGCQGVGGGISSFEAVTVAGSTFSGNNAGCDGQCEALGGAVYAPTVDITGSGFSQNVAGCSAECENVGGAVFTGGFHVQDSTFTGNGSDCTSECAACGGAIGAFPLNADAASYAPPAASAARSGWGGVVSSLAIDQGEMQISRSTFSGNTGTCDDGFCGASGGALFLGDPISLSIDASTFDHNVALFEGGAIDVQAEDDPPVSLVNSTVTQNSSGIGGAIVIDAGPASFAYDTIVQNAFVTPPATQATAAEPANLTVSDPTFFGTIVALPIDGPNCDVPGSPSQGYNFSDDDTCGFDQATDDVATPNDPGLGALAANGGPTQTMLPQSGSPVIDAIPSAACQTGIAAGITTDQRGVTRPQGPGCDIGAVEVEVLAPTPSPLVVTPKFTG